MSLGVSSAKVQSMPDFESRCAVAEFQPWEDLPYWDPHRNLYYRRARLIDKNGRPLHLDHSDSDVAIWHEVTNHEMMPMGCWLQCRPGSNTCFLVERISYQKATSMARALGLKLSVVRATADIGNTGLDEGRRRYQVIG